MSEHDFLYVTVLMLVVSLAINTLLIFYGTKGKDKDKSATLKNANIVKYVLDQIVGTKKHLSMSVPEDYRLNNKVIALRTAYLNIEKKALDKDISSPEYWRTINAGLEKLLKIFLPQIFGRENEVKGLESKVKLLQDRICKLSENTNSKTMKKTVGTINEIIPAVKNNNRASQIVTKYIDEIDEALTHYSKPKSEEDKKNQIKKIRKTISFLDNLKSEINNQNKSVGNTHDQIGNMISIQEESDIHDLELKNKLKESEANLNEFKNKNIYLEKKIDRLRVKLGELEEEQIGILENPRISIQNDENEEFDNDSFELESNIKDAAEKEIDDLKCLLKDQDSSMIDLQKELSSLKIKLSESVDIEKYQSKNIDKLNKKMRDSENCVKTLEREIEDLNTELSEYKILEKESKLNIFREGDFEELENKLESVSDELHDSIKKLEKVDDIIRCYSESIDASSIEDLSVVIYQNLLALNCQPNIWINYNNKEIVLSGSGAIPQRTKVIVENMNVGEQNLDFDGKSIKFRFNCIKGIITSKINDSNHDDALDYLKYADKLVAKIIHINTRSSNVQLLEQVGKSIKLMAFEIDKNLDNQSKDAKELISTNYAHLEGLADSGALAEMSLAQLQKMKANSLVQIGNSNTKKMKFRKDFLTIIELIERVKK